MAVFQPILLHIVPGTLHQQRLARGARSMRPIAIDIAFVDVVQARFERNGARRVQSFRRSARLIPQLEIGMERGEMQRHVRAQMFQDPFGQAADLAGRRRSAWESSDW